MKNHRHVSLEKKSLRKKIGKIVLLFFLLCVSYVNAQTLPPGFSQVKIATIYYPTAMAFAPDGRIFCAQKAGSVKIVQNGAVVGTLLNVSVDQQNEHGLAGIAVDPDFNTNKFVYVYYTTSGQVKGRLSRFTVNGNTGSNETILLETEPLVNSIHCGGGITFGGDGKLYIGIGNDNVNANSQNIHNLKGKVLRLNKDGSAAAGNPFSGSDAASKIWAYGLRNPWTVVAGSGKVFVNDVGEGAFEEINDCTVPGKNFGWPATEGYHNNPSYSNPLHAYPHAAGTSAGCAISGGTFFNSSNYAGNYQGKYFFIDYCNGWINYIDPAGGTSNNFASNIPGSLNYVVTGNDGNLYYYSISENSLYKIIYSGGGNSAPVINTQPNSVTVAIGQQANFNVSASGTAPLAYQWLKNGQAITGANAASYVINNVQNSDAGTYKVTVSNSIGSATSNDAILSIGNPNTLPVAVIQQPAAGHQYKGGDIITFSGSASDAEDGNLPAASLNWIVDFHHAQHVHPGPFITPGITNGNFQIPNDGEKSADVWYRLKLIASDSNGGTDTAAVEIHPKKSVLTLESQPHGLSLLLNDQAVTATHSTEVVSGIKHSIGAPATQNFNDSTYAFDHWVHGGTISQEFFAGDNSTTYTAVYKATQVITVKELSKKLAAIVLYPNPASGSFYFDICLDDVRGETLSLKLTNATGQVVYSEPPASIVGCSKKLVNLNPEISPGVYFLQIKVGSESKTAKLILNAKR